MSNLMKRLDMPKSEFLVFSSMGDRANIKYWLKGNRNFDLWVCYYGDDGNKYIDSSDYYFKRKGGKFPNLHYVYNNWKNEIDFYKAVFVIDDDVILNGTKITNLFNILFDYKLWLIQPAFNPLGKVSHYLTMVKPYTKFRYTNFVEVTCPLFLKSKLDEFMNVYDPVLVGWGVDHWFINNLGSEIANKVAVIDEITCINPFDFTKNSINFRGKREIDTLQSKSKRVEVWKGVKAKYNINDIKIKEIGYERLSLNLYNLINIFYYSLLILCKLIARRIRSTFIYKKRR